LIILIILGEKYKSRSFDQGNKLLFIIKTIRRTDTICMQNAKF
jgi:hypothetical protein